MAVDVANQRRKSLVLGGFGRSSLLLLALRRSRGSFDGGSQKASPSNGSGKTRSATCTSTWAATWAAQKRSRVAAGGDVEFDALPMGLPLSPIASVVADSSVGGDVV
eukprot:gene11843-8441_t